MSVVERKRGASCKVSEKKENNFVFYKPHSWLEELQNKEPEYSGNAVWGAGVSSSKPTIDSSLGCWQLCTHQPAAEEINHVSSSTANFWHLASMAWQQALVGLATSRQRALAVEYLATDLVSRCFEGTCCYFAGDLTTDSFEEHSTRDQLVMRVKVN